MPAVATLTVIADRVFVKLKTKSTQTQIGLEPLWLRVSQASYRYGLSRTRLFALIGEGVLESRYLVNKNKAKGVRLVSDASLKRYVESFDSEGNRKAALT